MLIFRQMIRIILICAILVSAVAVKAQTPSSPGTTTASPSAFGHPYPVQDTSNAQKKWFVTKYAGLSTGFIAFKGGGGSFLSAPLGLQINRKLTNNVYAFGNVSAAPYIFHSNTAFYQPAVDKNTSFMRTNTNHFGISPSAQVGVMYINNERTFSISGSIGVSTSNYGYSPFYGPVNAPLHSINR